LLVSSTFL